jgi:hypothetical protein
LVRAVEGREGVSPAGAFERIFGATIFFGTDTNVSTARLVHRARFNFLREAHIWYNRTGAPAAGALENIVVLSEEFYAEALAHPIPCDLEAVRVLASAPAVLDLFLWLPIVALSRRAKSRFRSSVNGV